MFFSYFLDQSRILEALLLFSDDSVTHFETLGRSVPFQGPHFPIFLCCRAILSEVSLVQSDVTLGQLLKSQFMFLWSGGMEFFFDWVEKIKQGNGFVNVL